MTRCNGYDDDAAAPALHFSGSDDRLLGVVPAFDDDVGLQVSNEIEWGVFRKDDHEIDAFQRRQHVSSVGIGAHRSRGPFEASHGVVAVESDDEGVTRGARGGEDVDVTGMQ